MKRTMVTEIHGDATAGYSVDLEKEQTLKEFVETILNEYAGEWGKVSVVADPEKGHKYDDPGFWYRYGKLDGVNIYKELESTYGDRIIDKIEGSGGYSRMDYVLWLKEEKIEVPKTEQEAEKVTEESEDKEPAPDILLRTEEAKMKKTEKGSKRKGK